MILGKPILSIKVVYRLLSLPLSQGSRSVLFVDTDLPQNRTRLFKPINVLKQLDDNDRDVFLLGTFDRYPARPNNLENMCLHEFVSLYKTCSKPLSTNEARAVNKETNMQQSKRIQLKDNMGYMLLRQTPATVRYHQWSPKKQAEQYFHAQLLLYFPWRTEIADLYANSYKENYLAKVDIVQQNRRRNEYFSDELDDVLEDIQEYGIREESWHVVAPETEKEQSEEEIEGAEIEYNPMNAFESITQQRGAANFDTGCTSFHYEMLSEEMSTSEWIECILSLNQKQYSLHQCIVEWASKMTLSHRIPKPDPFCLFLTGGAGVCKSHLVRTIVQTVIRIFAINNQGNENHVLVCAPTGVAAYNISGYTCHVAFILPLQTKKTDDYIPLSTEKLAVVKETFSAIKLIVIDEISMVGADTLLTIHRRLCDIMSNTQSFGGISILAVGDLLQLPAVAQKPIFAKP